MAAGEPDNVRSAGLASPAGHRAQRDHPARDQLAKGPVLPGLAMAAGEPDNVRSAGLASPAGYRAQRDHPARDQLAKGPAGEHPPGRALPLADPLYWPRGQPRRASSSARSPCKGSAGQGARLPGLAMAAGEPDNVRSAGQASPAGYRAQRDHPAGDQVPAQ